MTLSEFSVRLGKFKRWISQDSGTLTIDWTLAITAAVGLGLAGATLVFASTDTPDAMVEHDTRPQSVMGQNLVTNGTFAPEGFQLANGHFVNFDNSLAGWDIHTNPGSRIEILPSSHYGFTRERLGPADYLLDTIGAAGEPLSLSQAVDLPHGVAATLRFNAGSVSATHQTQVFWGGELIETLDVHSAPSNELTRFAIPIIGGSGDGTNALRFETATGTGYAGTLLHDVRIN